MYQVTIKGRSLKELKKAVSDINNELTNGATTCAGIEKDMTLRGVANEAIKILEEPIAELQDLPMVETPIPIVEIPVMSAPIVEIPVTSAPVVHNPNAELDAEGLPWDKRIHTIKRTKVTTGTWKVKRGTDKDLLKSVKDELRNSMQRLANPTPVPTPPLATPLQVAPAAVVEAPTPVVQPPVVETPAPAPVQAAPVPTPTIPSANGHTTETFIANFPMILGNLISEGKVTQDYINQLKTYFNVTEIWNISDDQKKEMFEYFASGGLIQKVG